MASNLLHFGRETEEELASRRRAALRKLDSHIETIKAGFPDIDDLRREIKFTALDFADKIVAAPAEAEALDQLAKKLIAEKETELREKLVSCGFPADYLDYKPHCEICGDTGIVDGEMCGCMKRFLIAKVYSGSGLDPEQTFENFRHDLISDPIEKRAHDNICAFCTAYADRFPDNSRTDILLMGAPGVGKTFLLNCIGWRVLNNGHSVFRITANRMISDSLESIRNHTPAQDLVMPDLLIIDDLGTEPMINNVTVERLLSVICERQDAKKATLIATNKDVSMLSEEYGERIVSRLLAPDRVKAIKMTTPSIRMMRTKV